MSLYAHDENIYSLLNDKLYIVPINQRKYVWEQNNWQELFDDIQLAYELKKPEHFIGSVVLKEEKNNLGIKNCFSIIDGQQRISTLTIILCAIGLLFAEIGEQGSFGALDKNLFVKNSKNEEFTILSKESNKDISNLVQTLFDSVLVRFNSKTPMINKDELLNIVKPKKKISECFIFFYNKIKELSNGERDNLEQILKTVQDIKYIDVLAKNDEDAFTIFEILNARGQPLRDFDMLKNYMLKYTLDNEKDEVKSCLNCIEELLGDNIELFLKHYVIHKYGKKPDKTENRPYKTIVKEEKNKDKKVLLLDLMKKVNYYDRIINYTECSDIEKKIFSFFKPRRQQQFRPIVLGLMHQLELGNLTQEEYNKELEYLYKFFICYNVISEQTSNKIEDIVYKYSKEIENSFSKEILTKFRKSMGAKIPDQNAFYGKVFNVRYSNHFETWSGSKKKDNVSAILEVIEKELGYTGVFDDSITIEHILSDTISEDNSVIGNLLLLEDSYNQLCKNKDIKDKLCYYQKSKLKLPIKFYNEYNHSEFDIQKRTEYIAQFLYEYINKESYLRDDE